MFYTKFPKLEINARNTLYLTSTFQKLIQSTVGISSTCECRPLLHGFVAKITYASKVAGCRTEFIQTCDSHTPNILKSNAAWLNLFQHAV